MTKSIEDYNNWKTKFVDMILQKSLSEHMIDKFQKFSNQILTNGNLDPPLNNQLDDFVDFFIPVLIEQISNQHSLNSQIEKTYENILLLCVKIFAKFLTSNFKSLIASGKRIIGNPNLPFYLNSFNPNAFQYPNAYIKCCKIFADKTTLKIALDYINSSSPDIITILEIIDILKTPSEFFDPKDSSLLVENVANALWKMTQSQNARDIDENLINQIFISLGKYDILSDYKAKLYYFQIKIGMKIINSDVLTKQYSILKGFDRACKKDPDTVVQLLKAEKFIDFFLQKCDFHIKLIHRFCKIFACMYSRGCINYEQFKDLWEKTTDQPQSTFPAFINGIELILKSIRFIDPFVKIVIETNKFNNSVLQFLQAILNRKTVYVISQDSARLLFSKMLELYNTSKVDFEQTNASKFDLKLILNAIELCIDTNDAHFCNQMQNICMQNIENGKDIELSLHILNCAFQQITPEKAQNYFQIIIHKINEDSIEYLNLLVKIMRKFDHQIGIDDYNKIQEISQLIIKNHPDAIINFYMQALDEDVSTVPLFDQEMKYKILKFFTSLSFNEKNFEFIKEIYQILNKYNIKSHIGIDLIWSYLFSTNNFSVSDFLIQQYKFSSDPNFTRSFIKECSKYFKSRGVLFTLNKFIHKIQDGIEFDPPPNQFLFDDDFITITLIFHNFIYESQTIKFPKFITHDGFLRKLAIITNIDSSCLSICDNETYATEFALYDGMTLDVTINNQRPLSQDNIVYPYQILNDALYYNQLFEILMDEDLELSKLCLEILNQIPTIHDQIAQFHSNVDWEEFFCIDMPYLLLYRMNMVGNLIMKDPKAYIQIFFPNGIIALLNVVFNVASNIFPEQESIIKLLRISVYMLNLDEAKQYKEMITDSLKDCVPTLLQWISQLYNENQKDDENTNYIQILGYLISILNEFTSSLFELPEFSDIVKNTIFHKSQMIRKGILQILSSMKDVDKKYNLMIQLFPDSKNSKCEEFFYFVSQIALETSEPEKLWSFIIDILYNNFTLPTTGTLYDIVQFKVPPNEYSTGIFNIMNSVVNKIKEIPDMKKLFNFLSKQIIFNSYKYYAPTSELFSVFLNIIERDRSLINDLSPILAQCKKYIQTENKYELNENKKNKGIKNMGATCYINAIIQQLFHIKEFREQILASEFDEKDWSYEFQYAFVKLLLFPARYIDISNFLNCWEGYDNKIIDVHQQQDAVEFLQLLLDRLDQKIPKISLIFTGEIEHKTYVNESMSSNKETFTTFSLDVKNHKSIQESLNTFLEPDRFETNVKDNGKMKAFRLHKVKTPPTILIIQLKRFEYNIQKKEREKINSKYEFSSELDFSPVMIDNLSVFYDLCGVVQHTGTAQGGHYFSDVKNDEGKWFCLNDTISRKVNLNQILKDAAGGSEEIVIHDEKSKLYQKKKIDKTCNAYLLFYRIRETADIQRMPSLRESYEKIGIFGNQDDLLNFSSDDNITSKEKNQEGNSSIMQIDDLSFYPGINHSNMKRLLCEIKEAILKTVCNTLQFQNLIINTCQDDQNFDYIYYYFVNCLKNSNIDNTQQLMERILQYCQNHSSLANFIINHNQDFEQFLIHNHNRNTRIIYFNLIKDTLKYCSKDVKSDFFNFLNDFLINKSAILINESESISSFIQIFFESAPISFDSIQFLSVLLNFIIQSIPDYNKLCPNVNAFNNIDLTDFFSLINKYSNSTESKEYVAEQLLDTPVFLMIINSNNINQVFSFLVHILSKSDKNINLFISFLQKNKEKLSIPAFALFFNVISKINHSGIGQIIFNILSKRPMSSFQLFFDNLTYSGSETKDMLLTLSNLWIEAFLINTDINIRSWVQKFIHSMFLNKVRDVKDIQRIQQLYEVMVKNVHKLDDYTNKQYYSYLDRHKTLKEDIIPTDTYYFILYSLVSKGKINIVTDFFFKEMKQYTQKYNYISQFHAFQFLVKVLNKNIFTEIPFSSFLKIFDSQSTRIEVNILLLPIIPENCINEYIKSSMFGYFCIKCFSNNNDLFTFIKKNVNSENANYIIEKLLQLDVIVNYIQLSSNIIFFQLIWQIFKKYDGTSSKIFENDCYLAIFNKIMKKHPLERPLANMLAIANFDYAKHNKGKKHLFKSKTEKLFENYEYNHELLNHIIQNVNIAQYGNGGICNLLRSFIALKPSFSKDLLVNLLNCSKSSLIYTCSPQKAFARLICDICMNAGISRDTDFLMYREIQGSFNSPKALDVFCSALLQYKSKDPSFFENIYNLILEFFNLGCLSDSFKSFIFTKYSNPEVFKQIRGRTQKLICQEVHNAGFSLPTIDKSREISNLLKLGFNFVNELSNKIGDRAPKINIPDFDSQKLLSLYDKYQLNREMNEYLMFIK